MSNSSERTIEQRVQEAVSRALGIRAADAAATLRMGATPGWDSMGHMTVVMEIEKEFHTAFPPFRLPELTDVASIARAVKDLQK